MDRQEAERIVPGPETYPVNFDETEVFVIGYVRELLIELLTDSDRSDCRGATANASMFGVTQAHIGWSDVYNNATPAGACSAASAFRAVSEKAASEPRSCNGGCYELAHRVGRLLRIFADALEWKHRDYLAAKRAEMN